MILENWKITLDRLKMNTALLEPESGMRGCYIQNCAGGEMKEIPNTHREF